MSTDNTAPVSEPVTGSNPVILAKVESSSQTSTVFVIPELVRQFKL